MENSETPIKNGTTLTLAKVKPLLYIIGTGCGLALISNFWGMVQKPVVSDVFVREIPAVVEEQERPEHGSEDLDGMETREVLNSTIRDSNDLIDELSFQLKQAEIAKWKIRSLNNEDGHNPHLYLSKNYKTCLLKLLSYVVVLSNGESRLRLYDTKQPTKIYDDSPIINQVLVAVETNNLNIPLTITDKVAGVDREYYVSFEADVNNPVIRGEILKILWNLSNIASAYSLLSSTNHIDIVHSLDIKREYESLLRVEKMILESSKQKF